MVKAIPHQKLPTVWKEREVLRDKGQFWTPDWVAQAMVAYVMTASNLVFDPATGNGSFFDALLAIDNKDHSYYGTDIDPEVLKSSIYDHQNCRVELRDFIKDPPQRKFAGIVVNPPYIRHHRLNEETKASLRQLCRGITGFVIDGRAGYHIYFFLQVLSSLDVGGKLAIIMPADTCEGKFAPKLWQWISANYCIEAVATFSAEATPFPNVDTNAVVFFIKKAAPKRTLIWFKCLKPHSSDFLEFVISNFRRREFQSIEVTKRALSEAIKTGLSRPQQNQSEFKFRLHDFATVMRGIATGGNDFFFLNAEQKEKLQIPDEFFKIAIGRTKDALGDKLTADDISNLERENRPIYLLSINGFQDLPAAVTKYLKYGEDMGLSTKALITQRKPWYKMEHRNPPPILFTYLGRRNSRFIKNDAGVVPLTGFLCIYPRIKDEDFVTNLWKALNHPDTVKLFSLVGKSYGSGAIKIEPRGLDNLPIPDHVVEQFGLAAGLTLDAQQPLF